MTANSASGGRLTDDRGVATVVAAFVMIGLLAIALLVLHVGALVAVRHRAQAVADLAALAAASALEEGSAGACRAAGDIARRMQATVRRCEVQGWDAVVTVTAQVSLPTFGEKEAQAIARAGPIEG